MGLSSHFIRLQNYNLDLLYFKPEFSFVNLSIEIKF